MSKNPKKTLMQVMSEGQTFCPCVWDCLSARAVELCGFSSMLLSSAALSYSQIGLPDCGFLTIDEVAYATSRISAVSPLPLIVDGENGYSDIPLVVYRNVEKLVKAGAMAITLEDAPFENGIERMQAGMKRNQHSAIPAKDWMAKVKAALAAMEGSNCVLIARTGVIYDIDAGMDVHKEGGSCSEKGLNAAIDRLKMAYDAGAQIALACGITKLEHCQKIADAIPGYKMYPDVVSHNGVPDVNLDDIDKLGFKLVTMHYLEKGAMWGMLEYGRENFKNRNTIYSDDHDMGGIGALNWFEQLPYYNVDNYTNMFKTEAKWRE